MGIVQLEPFSGRLEITIVSSFIFYFRKIVVNFLPRVNKFMVLQIEQVPARWVMALGWDVSKSRLSCSVHLISQSGTGVLHESSLSTWTQMGTVTQKTFQSRQIEFDSVHDHRLLLMDSRILVSQNLQKGKENIWGILTLGRMRDDNCGNPTSDIYNSTHEKWERERGSKGMQIIWKLRQS